MLAILHRFFSRKKETDSSVVFIITLDLAAVMVWRGAWGFMDLYFFPLHPELSFLVSLILGLTLFALLKMYAKKTDD